MSRDLDLDLKPADFEEAIRILRRQGHTKKRSYDEDGRVCAARALNIAYETRTSKYIRGLHPMGLPGPTWSDVTKLMELPRSVDNLPQWNDLASTTPRDVELRFARAADNLRKQQVPT